MASATGMENCVGGTSVVALYICRYNCHGMLASDVRMANMRKQVFC